MVKTIKKNISLFLVIASLLSLTSPVFAAPAPTTVEDNIMDESVKDITTVIGLGAVGAILGLSTLSFVEKPSAHTKNIAVGGALGIIFGVGVVIFNQATKSSSVIDGNLGYLPMNPHKFEASTREDFKFELIAKNYFKNPGFTYNFSF